MAVLYFTRFTSIAGKNYEVELWDDATGTSPLQAFNIYKQRVLAAGGTIENEQGLIDDLAALSGSVQLTAQGEGVEIQRQGESDTFFDNPIRASRANCYFIVSTDAQLDAFKSIATDPEGTYAIKLYRENAPLFVGRVLADQMRFERADPDGKVTISVTAVDALNLIEGFFVDESWFTDDHAGGIYLIRKCLEYSGLDDFIGATQDYIFDGLEQYESATQSVSDQKLNTFWFHRLAFVDNFDIFGGIELEYVTAKKALEIILQGFGARIHHENGAFYITQTPTYLSSTLVFHKYDKSGNYNGTETFSHPISLGTLPARPQWEAKPQLYYQPPVRLSRSALTKANGAYAKKLNFGIGAMQLDFDRLQDGYPFRVQLNIESASASSANVAYQVVKWRIYGVDGSPTSLYYYYDGLYWQSSATIPNYKLKAFKYYSASRRRWPINIVEDFSAPITTGPAANITGFHIEATVEEVVLNFVKNPFTTSWSIKSSTSIDFLGSIAVSRSYTTSDPYNFTKNTYVNSGNSALANSIVKDLPQVFYDGFDKYELGTIMVGPTFATSVKPTDWANGWEAGYSENFQQSLVDQCASIYANFKGAIRGTWHDSGTLTAINSLYFDGGAWLLNGCNFTANSERWEGEWLKIETDYTEVISEGETENPVPSEKVYIQDQIDRLREQVGRAEDITGALPDQLINDFLEVSEGAPTTDPGADATYTLALKYDYSATDFTWQMRQLGASINVTSDITTFPTEYEIFVCDTSGGNITIDLPSPPSVTPGLRFGFIKTSSNHTLILDAGAGYSINDAQLLSWSSKWETYWVQSDGTQWYIVASNK